MGRVKRQEILKQLELVAPGLATREIIEQSSCFVFRKGKIITFNDEILCRSNSLLDGVDGAVQAEPLLALLKKLPDEEIEIKTTGQTLSVIGKAKRARLVMQQEIVLPFREVERPTDWRKIPKGFMAALELAADCASDDESQTKLACVHIHPDYVEASDNFQMIRVPLRSGIKQPMLIRKGSAKQLSMLKATQISEVGDWVHLKADGLIASCRSFIGEKYPTDTITQILGKTGNKVKLPKQLAGSLARAQIFSATSSKGNVVVVELRAGKMKLEGRGDFGWYEEVRKSTWEGENTRFSIAPKILLELSKRADECELTDVCIKVDGKSFLFACATEIMED